MPRKQRKRQKAGEGVDFDMTPMIDCVFLLLIFFMLISEITQADLERMELPKATMAEVDDKPPPDRLVLNIVKENPNDASVHAGRVIIRGRHLGTEELIQQLRYEANQDRNEEEGGISDRPLLIRCDRNVEYRYFERILMLCADPTLGIRMWKIEIAISKKD